MKQGKLKLMILLLFIAAIMLPHPLKSQTFVELTVSQPPVLTVNAGDDVTIDAGLSLVLGGSPVAEGGTGNLSYLWSPAYYIDQLTVQNPLATPPGNVTYTLTVSDERGCTTTDDIIITVIGGTGVATHNTEDNLRLYPNPSNGAFTLEIVNTQVAEMQISIVTLTGQVVHSEILRSTGTTLRTVIDLSSLPKGSYILVISNDFSEILRQIILN